MEDISTTSLERAILKALELSNIQRGERFYANEVLADFSWTAYGKRYDMFLKSLFINDTSK